MRLKQVLLEENAFGNGLKAVEMKNLGQVVALFGPNGAGKSRLLRSVETYVGECKAAVGSAGEEREKGLERSVTRDNRVLANLHEQMKEFLRSRHVRGRSRGEVELEINRTAESLNRNERALEEHLKLRERVSTSYSEEPSTLPVLVRLGFPIQRLSEVNEYPQSRLDESMKMITNWVDANQFGRGVTPFLHNMARAAFNAKNPNADQNELRPWLRLYEEGKRVIRLLMRMEFDYVQKGADGLPALDGRRIRIGELSEGQRVLLMYTVCLLKSLLVQFEGGDPKTVKGAIILIDEPELHLHPAAVIQFIGSMRDIVGERGQIWLGTHAVCLLPHLKPGEIWTVYAGEVKPPGIDRKHEAVELLVGSEENVAKQQSFLQEPAKWAAARFTAECLLPPERRGFKTGDPQMFQITSVIKKRLEEQKQLCILDCGGGRGRLARMLRETFNEDKQSLIEYLPIEPEQSCHEELRETAGEMLPDCGVLLSVEGIPNEYEGKIEIAVLCNVLHEIRPTKWCHELNVILAKLADEGAVVICEDQRIPVGELPHELGYLVLGSAQIQTLFSLKQHPRERMSEEDKYKDRLLCVEIPVRDAKVTQESVKRAVENLRGHLDGLIQVMRGESQKVDARAGRDYAFYSEMFVNCEFALRELR